MTMTPPEASNTRVLQEWTGMGSVAFHQATWQQLPTLVTIVNALAGLPIGEVVAAGMTRTIGGVNFRGQVCLDRTQQALPWGRLTGSATLPA